MLKTVASLIDDVAIYDCDMFTIKANGGRKWQLIVPNWRQSCVFLPHPRSQGKYHLAHFAKHTLSMKMSLFSQFYESFFMSINDNDKVVLNLPFL
jgi:hypothetical protein